MNAGAIYFWWALWLGVGGLILVAAAALLIVVLLLARRIAALAQTAIETVGQIEENTKPVWQLNASKKAAKNLLRGTGAIEGNAVSIYSALTQQDSEGTTGQRGRPAA